MFFPICFFVFLRLAFSDFHIFHSFHIFFQFFQLFSIVPKFHPVGMSKKIGLHINHGGQWKSVPSFENSALNPRPNLNTPWNSTALALASTCP